MINEWFITHFSITYVLRHCWWGFKPRQQKGLRKVSNLASPGTFSSQISDLKNFRNATLVNPPVKKQSNSKSRAACWSISSKVNSASGGGDGGDAISAVSMRAASDILLNISASSTFIIATARLKVGISFHLTDLCGIRCKKNKGRRRRDSGKVYADFILVFSFLFIAPIELCCEVSVF